MEKTKKETQRVNLFLDPKIVKAAKIHAIRHNDSLSKVVDQALVKFIDQDIEIDFLK